MTSCKKKYRPRSHGIVPRRFATLNQRSQVSVKDALLYTCRPTIKDNELGLNSVTAWTLTVPVPSLEKGGGLR